MRLNDSRRGASSRRITAHRRERKGEKQSSTQNQILDPPVLEGRAEPNMERQDNTLRPDDFVFLSDNRQCWLIRTADIWFLEARGEQTRVEFLDGTIVIRRILRDCERRLDASTFFRASRDFVINLTHVKQTRLLDSAHLLFLLPNGKEIVVSGSQNALFRKIRAL
ncbi:MAG: LytTR family DNA-binding domain-containing protein [Terrimicrobiaceae bacterium]